MLYKLLHKNNANSSRLSNKKMRIKNEPAQDGATPLYIDSVTKVIIKECPTKSCHQRLP